MKAKIYKVLSVLLALAVVFSTCVCVFGTVYADSTEYEVSSTGTYKTIDEVIIAANAAGKVAGDVVTAKIADGDEVLMSNTSDFSTEHAFTLVITSENGAKLATEVGADFKRNIILGGPTVFDNVEINVNGKSFRGNGEDFKFGHGVTFKEGPSVACVRTGGAYSDITVTETSNIELGVSIPNELQIVTDGTSKLTYEKDLNIVYNDTSEAPVEQTIRLGISGYGDVVFEGNINLNVKAGSCKFNSADNAYINGNIQVINSASMNIWPVWNTTSTEYERWDLTNLTPQYNNVLGFIEGVTGKYSVAEGYKAIATDSNGATYVSINGVLDLTAGGAGAYTVRIVAGSTTETYYAGNGTAPEGETLYATIKEAVNAALADGLVAGDIAEVKVVGTEAVLWAADSDVLPDHAFTLKIASASEDEKASITAIPGCHIILGGTTEFSNIKIEILSGRQMRLNSFSVKFDEKVEINNITEGVVVGRINDYNMTEVPQNIEINCAVAKGTVEGFIFGDSNDERMFNHLITVTYDNAEGAPHFSFGTSFYQNSVAKKATYAKPVNFNIKNAAEVTFANAVYGKEPTPFDSQPRYVFAEGSALQVINSSDVEINATSGELANIDASLKWIITNTSEYKDVLSFTDTVGVYAVADGEYRVFATKNGDETGTVYSPVDGVLDLTAGGAGEYSVRVVVGAMTETYYAGNGTAPEGETLYATIKEAVNAALADGLVAGDIAEVKVVGTEAVLWAADSDVLPDHAFTLKIASASEDEKASITAIPGCHIILGGTTEFSNIKIEILSGRQMRLNSFSVKFDEKVEINNITEGVVVGRINDYNMTEVPQNIEINCAVAKGTVEGFIFGDSNDERMFNHLITVTYDNAEGAPHFSFGTSFYQNSVAKKATYAKPVNFNIKNAAEVTFANAVYGQEPTPVDLQPRYVFAEGSALQVINSSDVEINATSGELANIDASLKWIITNTSEYKDVLSFTDTVGVYAVADGEYRVFATKNGDETGTIYKSADGVLDLTAGGAGEYTVKIVVGAMNETYYAGNGTAPEGETLYATIKEAVNAALADGLVAGDIAEVKVVGTEAVLWAADSDVLPDHAFTLKIASASEDEKASITAIPGCHIILGGTTEFSNIKIEILSGRQMRLNSFSVKFDEKVEINNITEGVVVGRINDYNMTEVPQNIEINCAVAKGTVEGFIFGDSNDERMFNHSITVTYDNAEGAPHFSFGTSFYQNSVAKKATYAKPVNFNIKNAAEVTFANAVYGKEPTPVDLQPRYVFAEGSALQVINSSDVEINATSGELANIDASLKWILTVDSGIDGVLSFTETAGIYNVAEGYDVVVVKNGEETGYVAVEGVLDLTEAGAGEYTVHVRDDEWSCDAEGHWFECIGCDYVFEATKAAHTPDHEGGATTEYAILCADCEYVIEEQLVPEIADGWVLDGGKWVYYVVGELTTGWKYLDAWYLFDDDGTMQTGWKLVDGGWYYMDAYGRMQTGWEKIDGDWYYFDTYGRMQTGWELVGSTWYYMDAYGRMQTGWVLVGGSWYYLQASGAMATGWLKLGTTWYYLQANGAMATGSLNIGGIVYRFNAYGAWVL